MTLALIEISTPKGAPWEFLVVFAVLLLGPVLFRRAGIPGLIGLLVGGYAIGPHGLSLIGAGNNTLPDLGQLGLLYLMFVAGVELDLNLLRKYRRSAVSFGLLTFVAPVRARHDSSASRSAGKRSPRSCSARCSRRTR